GGGAVGDRQPGQGRLRPGGAEHEHPVRPRRADGSVARGAAALMDSWRGGAPGAAMRRLAPLALLLALPAAFYAGHWQSQRQLAVRLEQARVQAEQLQLRTVELEQ